MSVGWRQLVGVSWLVSVVASRLAVQLVCISRLVSVGWHRFASVGISLLAPFGITWMSSVGWRWLVAVGWLTS